MKFSLSQADVAKLLQHPSVDTRASTVRKVAAQLDETSLTEAERELVEEILRAMVRDAEVRVRRALSDSLKDHPSAPHDVALRLANDVSEVALPMIEFSKVLTEDDLIEIVRSKPEDSQLAVARRQTVSASVADALVETQNETVVAELVGNDGADISEGTYQRVLDEFGDSETVNTPLVQRRKLPITIAERLVTLVSDSMREYLVTHHELSSDLATDLVLQSRERATVGLLSDNADDLDVAQLVAQLHANGRLTQTIVLRALCMGDASFFEISMAKLAGIPLANARVLIFDYGQLGLKSLCDKCSTTPEFFPVVRVAVDVLQELEHDGRPGDRERFRNRMIERVLTHFESGIDSDNLEYLVAKLGERAHV